MKKWMPLFYILPVLALIISCNSTAQTQKTENNSGIESIAFTYSAGRGGKSEITATPTTLDATAAGGMFTDAPKFSKKIDAADWKKLTETLDVKLLEKTQSGEMTSLYDAPEETYIIKAAGKEYRIVNPSEKSEGYKQLKTVKELLRKLAAQYSN